ncbi:hypothetical protein [Micrococcoides hystricis]|uniref:Uncharacterized protein n=1 Tax=Micrococcoides hystricis TaxID=1572761 RepID=A0ABV6PAT7_9MICC
MPSFRLLFNVHELFPGHHPDAVMDTTVQVVASHGFVEANQLNVRLRGGVPVPEITVRFTLPESSETEENLGAEAVRADVHDALGTIASTSGFRILRRVRGKWVSTRS